MRVGSLLLGLLALASGLSQQGVSAARAVIEVPSHSDFKKLLKHHKEKTGACATAMGGSRRQLYGRGCQPIICLAVREQRLLQARSDWSGRSVVLCGSHRQLY